MEAVREVTRVNVSDGINVRPGEANYPIRTVRFWIGTQGPFELVYRRDAFKPETANADMQKQVDELRAIGAIEA